MEQYEIINIPMLEPVRDIEMLSALSRCISVTYNGPDVTCNETVKRIEITALEQYMETGKSGAQIIDRNEEEEQND